MHMTRFQGERSKPYSAVLDLNELKQFLLASTHVEDMFDTSYLRFHFVLHASKFLSKKSVITAESSG